MSSGYHHVFLSTVPDSTVKNLIRRYYNPCKALLVGHGYDQVDWCIQLLKQPTYICSIVLTCFLSKHDLF